MLTAYAALFVICLLLMGGLVGYAIGKVRAWRLISPELDRLVQERMALSGALVRARHLADLQGQVCREYQRLWKFWQATAFRTVWDAHPEARDDVAAVQAKLLAHNAIALDKIEQAIKGLRQ